MFEKTIACDFCNSTSWSIVSMNHVGHHTLIKVFLKFCHSIRKAKIRRMLFFENQIDKSIKGFSNLGKYSFDHE